MSLKAAIPQQQGVLPVPAREYALSARPFPLATRTQFDLSDQMRPTFDQIHQAGLRKRTVHLRVLGAVLEGDPIGRRLGDGLADPIQTEQSHAFPTYPWRLDGSVARGEMLKEFFHHLATQLFSPITERRWAWDVLSDIIAVAAQATDQLVIHPTYGTTSTDTDARR